MATILRDEGHELQLKTKGFAVAGQLSAAGVHKLETLYHSLNCNLTTEFHADMYSSDCTYRRKVLQGIQGIVSPVVDSLFIEHRVCVANFVVKEALSPGSAVGVHQDWTVVMPPMRSYNIFIPLCDVGLENGCLHVIPGSHRANRVSPATFHPLPAPGLLEEINRCHTVPVVMNAGELLVYDGSLLHSSPPNQSAQRRIAVVVIAIPKQAPLRLFYLSPGAQGDLLDLYEVNDNFFVEFNVLSKDRPTNATFLQHIRMPRPPITREEINSWKAAG